VTGVGQKQRREKEKTLAQDRGQNGPPPRGADGRQEI